MDIGSLLYEIDGITKELVRIRKTTKDLNTRKKNLTNQIISIMKDNGDDTLVHNGKTFELREIQRYGRKSDKKRHEDAIVVLQDEGINGDQAEDIYRKLSGVLKGPEITTFTLKI